MSVWVVSVEPVSATRVAISPSPWARRISYPVTDGGVLRRGVPGQGHPLDDSIVAGDDLGGQAAGGQVLGVMGDLYLGLIGLPALLLAPQGDATT